LYDPENNSRRSLNKLKCRQSILKASRRLFSKNGYEDTSIDEVAAKAEVSRATLYNYFPNKESLLIGIAEEELEKVKEAASGELKDVERADEKLYKILEVFVLDSLMYLNLSRKITYLNSCEESDLYATRVDMIRILKDLAAEAQEQGIFRPEVPVSDIVDIIMSIYLMTQFQWKSVAEYTEDYCVEKLKRIFVLALSGVYVDGVDILPSC
jgi:AcrR family transcriptional regulator